MSKVNSIQLTCLKPNDCSTRLALPEVTYDFRVWAIINDLEKAVEKAGGATLAVFAGVPWEYGSRSVNFLNYVAEMVVRTNRGKGEFIGRSYLASGGMSRLASLMKDVRPDGQIRAVVDQITRTIWSDQPIPRGLPDNLWYEQTDYESFCIKSGKGDIIRWVPENQVQEERTMGFLRLEFEEPSVKHFCQLIQQLHRFPGVAEFANG